MSDRVELSGFGAGKESIRGRNRKKVGGKQQELLSFTHDRLQPFESREKPGSSLYFFNQYLFVLEMLQLEK